MFTVEKKKYINAFKYTIYNHVIMNKLKEAQINAAIHWQYCISKQSKLEYLHNLYLFLVTFVFFFQLLI